MRGITYHHAAPLRESWNGPQARRARRVHFCVVSLRSPQPANMTTRDMAPGVHTEASMASTRSPISIAIVSNRGSTISGFRTTEGWNAASSAFSSACAQLVLSGLAEEGEVTIRATGRTMTVPLMSGYDVLSTFRPRVLQ